MLWSLVKIILFVAAIAALAFGASILTDLEGGIRVAVGNIEFNLKPLPAAILFVAALLAMWLALKVLSFLRALFRFLNGDETAISRYFDRNRERRGFEALSDGLMALASGEGRVAMAKAAKAEKYLARPELTNLIAAQAAEMSGDRDKATDVYKKLLTDDRTRFVGVRGIMKQKLEDGDTDTALKLAERAFALKPSHEETGDVLLKLQAKKADWTGARKTLGTKAKQGRLPSNVHKRRDAVLALSEAKELLDAGNSIESREAAIDANRLSPDLIPAAVLASANYVEQGNKRYATRVLKKAWGVRTHPDLAAAFAAIEPDETPEARIKRFGQLVKLQPDAAETKMVVAELNIAAGKYTDAREAVRNLVENDPTARSLTIMAAIERGEGREDKVVRGWLTRALAASRGPQWVCDNCQTVHNTWAPICDNCGALDTFSWRTSAQGEALMSGSSEMLPLIVGDDAVEEQIEAEVVDDQEIVIEENQRQ